MVAVGVASAILLPSLPRHDPRLPPAPQATIRDWHASIAESRFEASHAARGPGTGLPRLVERTFGSGSRPPLPDFAAAGFRVSGSAIAETAPQPTGIPDRTLILALAREAESADAGAVATLSIARLRTPLARFDTFSRARPLLEGETALSEAGSAGECSLAFVHGGFLWCIDGPDADDLTRVHALVVSAPREEIPWQDL